MDLVAIKFNRIEGQRNDNMNIENVDVNVIINNFEIKNKTGHISFNYRLDFLPSIGHLYLSGYAVVRESPKELARIESHWKDNKRLPEELEVPIVNLISSSSTVSSIFAGNVLDLVPPFVPAMMSGK